MPEISIGERRRAPRIAQSGGVEISFDDPMATTIHAKLIERSSSGFRASHECKNLDPGMEVRYQREGFSGTARVMWTHVLQGQRVSGFLLIHVDPS
jgi:hypothetical protein